MGFFAKNLERYILVAPHPIPILDLPQTPSTVIGANGQCSTDLDSDGDWISVLIWEVAFGDECVECL